MPFNLTRRTFVKVSPDLKQPAELTCPPTPWRAHEFRSLCEFVEALKMGCGYD